MIGISSDGSRAVPVCELIGGFPFVLPREGYDIPWFMAPAMDEARQLGEWLDEERKFLADLDDHARSLFLESDPKVRKLQRLLCAIERRIGTTAEHVIMATRGLEFGPSNAAERAAIREQIRWKRRLLAYRSPAENDVPEMTADECTALEKIERRRQEAEVATRAATNPEERTKAYDRGAKAGDDALALMAKIRSRQEAEWAAAALKEVDALAKIRGDEPAIGATGTRRRQTPLEMLAQQPKDRTKSPLITQEQYAAGALYGRTWQRLYGGKNGEGTGTGDLHPLDGRIADLKRLDEARGYAVDHDGRRLAASGLGGDARLITLCDDVCGAEKSIRATVGTSPHKRKIAMERLRTALGLLALHYGLLKTADDERRAA